MEQTSPIFVLEIEYSKLKNFFMGKLFESKMKFWVILAKYFCRNLFYVMFLKK